jgi:nucleoside-diphosphate-sugar epimerase
MNILITGACGFIGRALIVEFENRGHQLRLLDQNSPQEATTFVPGSTERALNPLKTDWPFIQAQITDPEAMRAACEGIDAVVHLAGEPRGLPEIGVETFRTNALGTFVAINAAHQAGIQRFTCASSINAFGIFYWRLSGKPVRYTYMPVDETFPPVPEDPYSLSKLVNEETCAAFHRAYGMTTAAFRFAGVWSKEMYEKRQAEGLQPTAQWSDDLYQWVHITDIVEGIRKAIEAADLPGYGAYTLSAADTRCPEATMDILRKLRPDLAQNVITPLEGRAPLLSIERARLTFGYSPRFRLGE